MKQCWICNKHFEGLSKEHIIPRLFMGFETTSEFSCESCNQAFGKIEQSLKPISTFMQYEDSARGEPTHSLPKGESRRNPTRSYYGENRSIELHDDGRLVADGVERPPGKISSDNILWRRGQVPLEVQEHDLHRSMLKAIMALACHVGCPRNPFGRVLEYLAGGCDDIANMQPTGLGTAPKGLFSRVCLLAPPATRTLYGVVVFGPLVQSYRLLAGAPANWPFCYEVKAYEKGYQGYAGEAGYMNWREMLLQECVSQSSYDFIGHDGVYAVRQHRQSGLLVKEASPSRSASRARGVPELYAQLPPWALTHGMNDRFGNWVKSLQSEDEHARFLHGAREMDRWMQGPHSGIYTPTP